MAIKWITEWLTPKKLYYSNGTFHCIFKKEVGHNDEV